MNPNPVVQPDAADVLTTRNVVKDGRGQPRLLEWSMMDVTCKVQHAYNTGCGNPGGGTIARTHHSRFRVAHGLSSTPQEVVLMRLETNLDDNAGAVDNMPLRGPNAVPGNTTHAGDNAVLARDTTAYSMVLLNTCNPVADSRYSYFTAGFPVALWPIVVTHADQSGGSIELPEYCGTVLSAAVNWWYGVGFGGTVLTDTMGVRVGKLACEPPASVPAAEAQWGQPDWTNRDVTIQYGATGFDNPILINAFIGPSNGMDVTVRVISRLWDAPTRRGVFVSPGPDAHPAP